MHYVFQISQLNTICAANSGHWRMIYCAVSDGKPIQHCAFVRGLFSVIKQVCH